jgi:putative peptidoglycan lipid II flippase
MTVDEKSSITKAAGLIGLATLLSRILGLIRDMVQARYFGAGLAADAFFVAYRIPNMLREMFAEGSMAAAFIPVFTEYLTHRPKEEARRLANVAFTALSLILLGISLLGIVAAPLIVKIIAPGFIDTPGKFDLTVSLTRIMFPFLLFIGLAAVAMGVLNSLRSFGAPALAPTFYNIFMILSIFFLSQHLTEPIKGLAIGVLLGGLAQFLIQLPSLKKRGFLFQPRLERHEGVRRIGLLAVPIIIGLSVADINLLINTLIASFLPQGSVTYLFYGMRLIQFPLGIFAVAVATAILPSMASQAARGLTTELRETLSFGLRLVFFITFPAMTGLIMFRIPIVHVLFQHGAFTLEDTLGTSSAVLFYSLGLWAYAGVRIVAPAFYALQDTRTPVKTAVIALLVNIVLNLALMVPLKHAGLALATSLSSILNLSMLLWILRRRLGRIGFRAILRSHLRVVLASLIIVVWGIFVTQQTVWEAKAHWFEKGALLAGGILLSMGGYFLVHALLKTEELTFLMGLVKDKWQRIGSNSSNV